MIDPSHRDNQTDLLGSVVQPEVKEFLETMVQMLPKITNMMQITSAMYDLAQELLRDTETAEIMEKSMDGEMEPLEDKVEDGVLLVHEAREQAKLDTSNVGMIGMYKMLKDPTIQKNLKFMKALLALIRERQEKELN